MRNSAIRPWWWLALLLCVQTVHAQRLFEKPEDAFSRMRRNAAEELALERAIDRESGSEAGTGEFDRDLEDRVERGLRADREEREDRADRARRRPRARGTPAVGFVNRSAALTVAWFTAPLKFDYRDWKTAGVFVSVPLVLILSGFDDKTFQLLTNHHTPSKDRLAERVDRLGEVPVAFGVLAGIGAYGKVFDDPRGVHTFESGIIATALSGGLVTALKYATGRTRPTAGVGAGDFAPFGGEMSFPSGHTAVAFSLAGVINYHYPGWIGRTAFLAACGTAWARVYNLHHWPSDVVFAAMISSATAHYVARANMAAAHGDLTFDPVFLDGGGGMAVKRRF